MSKKNSLNLKSDYFTLDFKYCFYGFLSIKSSYYYFLLKTVTFFFTAYVFCTNSS